MLKGARAYRRHRDRRAQDRRSAASSLAWPERRRGFDRRRRHPVTRFLHDNTLALVAVLVLLNALSLLDLTLTSRALASGAAEGNPLMAAAFESGWETAALVKLASMALVSGAIVYYRRYRRIIQVALAGVIGYTLLLSYHLIGAALIA
jgi:hypothetical protein